MSTNLSLLQNFGKLDYYDSPVPHVIINNALPDNIYDELLIQSPKKLIINTKDNINNVVLS